LYLSPIRFVDLNQMGKRKGAPQRLTSSEVADQSWSLKDVDVNMETDTVPNENAQQGRTSTLPS
jgi:hypothetical protein